MHETVIVPDAHEPAVGLIPARRRPGRSVEIGLRHRFEGGHTPARHLSKAGPQGIAGQWAHRFDPHFVGFGHRVPHVPKMGNVGGGSGFAQQHRLGPDDMAEDVAHRPAGQTGRLVPLALGQARTEVGDGGEFVAQKVDHRRLIHNGGHGDAHRSSEPTGGHPGAFTPGSSIKAEGAPIEEARLHPRGTRR